LTPPAGGGGDSVSPLVSPDGRYVLFSSTANNLVLTTNNIPIPIAPFPSFNVHLRDRASNTTTLVSVNLAGTGGGNGDSVPMGISTNARYALFESTASDLVAGDTNNAGDVFVRDLVAGTTLLVSINTNGVTGNGASHNSVMTPDGRYVAFASAVSNLVAGDINGIEDVFVRDLQMGTTVLVSTNATSTTSTSVPSASGMPDISADGRYVAFYSTATNLVRGVSTVGEVYVRDLVSGTTLLASTNARSLFQSLTGSTNIVSCNHRISADGAYVVFETCYAPSNAFSPLGFVLRQNLATGVTDLVSTNANPLLAQLPGPDGTPDISPDGRFVAYIGNVNPPPAKNTAIFLWDALNPTNTVVSVDTNNATPANAVCRAPSVTPDGHYVAFLCNASLTSNAPGRLHAYVRDVLAGTTRLADVNTNGVGAGLGPEAVPQLSADGSLVVFESPDTGLVPNDRNHRSDIFARNLLASTNEMISLHAPALPSQAPGGFSTLFASSVSPDGRYVAFASDADDLVANDTNGCRDVFLRDILLGTNLLVSANTNGQVASGPSSEPALSANGRYVAFSSYANDLVPGDTNNTQDVFLRDLLLGTTALASVNTTGTGSGNGPSYAPLLGADGRYLLFRSKAANLVTGSFTGGENLFLRDLQAGVTRALTTTGSSLAAMTPDGHFVAFVQSGIIYLWDNQAAALVATNSPASAPLALSISADGNKLAWFAGPPPISLSVLDRVSSSNWVAATGTPGPRAGLRFSLDGRFLTYAAAAPFPGPNQVYLYDCLARTNFLVSHSMGTSTGGDRPSDFPDISFDGRFVAFRSAADDLVPGDNNGVPDVFVYDQLLGTTTLLGSTNSSSPDNRSLRPVFSANGQTLLFESWASNLAPNDFNRSSDLFAFVVPYIYASISAGPTISWPAFPSQTYRVDFKDNLDDNWQTANGTVMIIGNRGYLTDLTPSATNRFYRVVGN
jgi:Tol biopolymer transport system component